MSEYKNDFFSRSFIYFQKIIKQSAPVASATYSLVGSVVVLGLVGYFLDDFLQTEPWLLIICLLIGVVIGFYHLAKTVWNN